MRTAGRFHRVWILLFATALATPACYTLLKHPNVDLTVYEETPESQCASCHSQEELYGFMYPPHHPAPPPDGPIVPPWWYDIPPQGPPGPTALRGFRPGDRTPDGPIVIGPGPINPPPGLRISGNPIREKDPDDKKGEKREEEIRDDRGKGGGGGGESKSSGGDNNDRPVRPKGKKGNEDG
jgi:hypothetical protein